MGRKKHSETSDEALERVYNKHVSVPEGLSKADWEKSVKDQLTGNAESLRELVTGKIADDLYKEYSSSAEQFKREKEKAKNETKEQTKERQKRELKEKVKSKLHPTGVKSQRQPKQVKERVITKEKGIFIAKQRAKSGKEYSRHIHRYTPQQKRFISARANNKDTKKLAEDFNKYFKMELNKKAIQTEKGRLRKKLK